MTSQTPQCQINHKAISSGGVALRPIDEICSQATTELYNELARGTKSESVSRIRAAITLAYSEFVPRILPQYLTQFAADLFNQSDITFKTNVFTVQVGGNRREVMLNASRRAWGATDEAFLVELPASPISWTGKLIGGGGSVETIPRPTRRPARAHGMCVVEISFDWHVDLGDTYMSYTFILEGVPDLTAICLRVPGGLRLPYAGVARIAQLSCELTRAFYSWMVETLSNAIRKKAVRLSTELYKRPRVLIRDIAPTLAFSCLIRGKDFVLFDDKSLTGFVDVMEHSSVPTGISALKLSGILLGEIVAQEQSGIKLVLDKRDGEHVDINLADHLAYNEDEALQHAITTAWGKQFVCIKLMTYKDGTFVVFCPAVNQARTIAYVRENLLDIQSEIKSSFGHIMSYINLIEDLKLSSIFDQEPRAIPKSPGLIARTGDFLRRVGSDRSVRSEMYQTIFAVGRKLVGL